MRNVVIAVTFGSIALYLASPPRRESYAWDETSKPRSQNSRIAVVDVDAVYRKCEWTRVAKEKINADLDERKAAIRKTKNRLEALTRKMESGKATGEAAELSKAANKLREDISFQEQCLTKIEERSRFRVKADFQKALRFVLADISGEKGIDLVFSTPTPSNPLDDFATDVISIEEIHTGALLYHNGLDITRLVIDRLD